MENKITAPSKILILVGSENPKKHLAAKNAVLHFHPNAAITVKGYPADHGITNWKSPAAEGQPFGLEQTCFGAVNRMNDCWNQAKNDTALLQGKRIYVVSFENGLTQDETSKKKNKASEKWYDTCFVSVMNVHTNCVAIEQGASIPAPFHYKESEGVTFDQRVKEYHNLVMPLIHEKVDLYLDWTKNLPEGPHSRDYYLTNSLITALNRLDHAEKAEDLIHVCATNGVVASGGSRYKNMTWMRDLSYMIPDYLAAGHSSDLLDAFRELCKMQSQNHKNYANGYETFNHFGQMPIVCVSDDRERDFLLQRIRGTKEDPFWQIQLWNYCLNNQPTSLPDFPTLNGGVCGPNNSDLPTLDNAKVSDLRNYYTRLLDFQEQLTKAIDKAEEKPPRPSFALRNFMGGTLSNLTPGTRDSEIHFIRALLHLFESTADQDKEKFLNEFTKPLANALFFLQLNVIDPEDGLPTGCDSRDIFTDLLYDAKTLTNAVFWYETLKGLLNHADILENTSMRQDIAEAISNHSRSELNSQKVPTILKEIAIPKENESSRSLNEILSEAVANLESTIKSQLLAENGQFNPRDFIPGERAALGLNQPLTPSPVIPIIKKDNPEFISGETIDPQSLAYAVLNGLISEEHYGQVLECFKNQDSPIGVNVFVPISGKTKEESDLLQRVKGRVIWPHVTWAVVRALLHMGTPESIHMAKEQRTKLTKLGLGEWYAIDPEDGHVVQGGDPQQGWAASGLLMAMRAFEKLSFKQQATNPLYS